MNNIGLTDEEDRREAIGWYFGIGSDDKLCLFRSSLMPLPESLRNFFRLISGPFRTGAEALNESLYMAAHYRYYLARRLPHLDTMSAEQHALATITNAACYVIDQDPKRLLFDALCRQVGLKTPALFEKTLKDGPNGSHS